ncbi:MAG TPA: hypothetical protein VFL63_03890 [Rhodanobacteraceae bacterium]|nr:hypothetical protein [Rhodanobacteraceae bacterium]
MPAQPATGAAPIVPFWNRLREITLYPAHMSSLLMIILLALGKLLVFVPFGFILVLLVTVAMYRYAFSCLRATANGYMEPPEFTDGDASSLGWKQIWLMVILLVVSLLAAVVFGRTAGVVAIVLLLGLALPAATMTLAMEESLLAALNPLRWLAIVGRIGWPYLAVAGLCLVIAASQRYAAHLMAGILPIFLAVIVIAIIANYALVMTFHLMGYLIFQYQDEIGFVPEKPQLLRTAAEMDPDQELLDEASELVRAGNPEAATERLRSHLRGRGGSPAVHTQYRKLLRLAHDNEGLLRHGHEYLNILLAQDKDRQALDLLAECQAIDPGFAPDDAAQTTRLARLAAQRGQAQVALRLLNDFPQRFPKSQYLAENGLLAATLMHERLNQDEQAHALLCKLKAEHPHDPLMPDIKARIALIEKMMTAMHKPAPEA